MSPRQKSSRRPARFDQSHPVLRSSIRAKILRQSVLLVAFCVLLLGGTLFSVVRSLFASTMTDASTVLYDLRALGLTVLLLSGLLLILAFLLSMLLANGLTRSLHELSMKIHALQPGLWTFRRTIRTGDEVEVLDGVIADLTARLRSTYEHLEELVAERTRQFQEAYALDRAMLESIAHGIIALDRQGAITDVNPAACLLLKRDRETILGSRGVDVLPFMERRRRMAPAQHPIEVVLKQKTAYRSHPSIHLSLLRPDNTILPVTLFVVPLLRKNRMFGALVVLQDVSEERQIDYMKSEFISLASHQLRTPLSSIRWYLELLSQEKHVPEGIRGHLQQITLASSRMARLIDALLHVARLEDRQLQPELTKVDVHSLLRTMMDQWRVDAAAKKVSLTVSIPRGKLLVRTDPTLLQVVVQNLVANAVKYTPSSDGVYCSVTSDQREVRIIIRDEGIGIPKAEQERVFQKFFRARNVREMDSDGTGLGLYMTREIVTSLGGTLTFVSKEGKGSTFTVTLPRQ